MALIKCPQCGHTVLSVASVCPSCSFLLTQQRFQQSQRGTLAECRNCGRQVASQTRTCPYCGLRHPGSRRGARRALVVAGIVTPLLVMAAVRANPGRPVLPLPTTIEPRTTPLAVETDLVPPPPDSPASSARLDQSRWTVTWVNVRERPGTDTDVVHILGPGQGVRVGERQGRWWPVLQDGRVLGYVANSVLQDTEPEPVVTSSAEVLASPRTRIGVNESAPRLR